MRAYLEYADSGVRGCQVGNCGAQLLLLLSIYGEETTVTASTSAYVSSKSVDWLQQSLADFNSIAYSSTARTRRLQQSFYKLQPQHVIAKITLWRSLNVMKNIQVILVSYRQKNAGLTLKPLSVGLAKERF